VTIVDKIDLLNGKKAQMELGGGADRIERQHASGKLTARERLLKLFDSNTFVELDSFVETASIDFGMQEKKVPCDGVIIGYGTVNERLVYAFAQDFTVLGGALGAAYAKKVCKIMDMAAKMGAPLVGLYDTSGARIEEGVDALAGYGDIVLRAPLFRALSRRFRLYLAPAPAARYSPPRFRTLSS
jgi:acetyl-CoA carboxylase carboxyltransferase component